MATMADVAKHANVSVMTVSRVINKNGYVKEETRRLVEQAIRELDYRPNLVAKSLVTGRSGIIAYVLSDICDPFYGSVCKGIENACFQRNYTAIICNADSNASVNNYIDMIIDRKLDGVIFHHLSITEQQVQKIQEYNVKCITIDNEKRLDAVSSLDSDDYNGAASVVEYLVERGYKKIGCIRGELPEKIRKGRKLSFLENFQHKIWDERTRGFEDTMKKFGLKAAGTYYGRGSATMEFGFECGKKIAGEILESGKLPDALYCQSDVLALGVLSEFLEKKIEVPQQMAIVGDDGLDVSRFLYPRITTVQRPRYEMGVYGAGMLLDLIENKQEIRHEMLKSTIFKGDTTR